VSPRQIGVTRIANRHARRLAAELAILWHQGRERKSGEDSVAQFVVNCRFLGTSKLTYGDALAIVIVYWELQQTLASKPSCHR
jgi:hypothetical protein